MNPELKEYLYIKKKKWGRKEKKVNHSGLIVAFSMPLCEREVMLYERNEQK